MEKIGMDGLERNSQATGRKSFREPLCTTGAQVITDNKIIIPGELAIGDRYCKVVYTDETCAGTAGSARFPGAGGHSRESVTESVQMLARMAASVTLWGMIPLDRQISLTLSHSSLSRHSSRRR